MSLLVNQSILMKVFLTALLSILVCFYSNGQENTFPATGNVGIGTTNIIDKLTIGEYGGAITLRDRTTMTTGTSSQGRINFHDYQGPAGFIALEHNYYFGSLPRALILGVNGGERLRINSAGNVGIGMTAPGAPLHVFRDFGNGASGNIAIFGSKSFWTVNDWEGLQLGFTQLRSIYEGGSKWGLGIRTGASDGIGHEVMRITGSGKVGIGTSNPEYSLDISGNGRFAAIGVPLQIKSTNQNDNIVQLAHMNGMNSYLGINSSGAITFANASGEAVMNVGQTGYVGIGTNTPDEMLSVNGKIRAREVKVEAANWPDYVFNEGYSVRSLSNLEKFIKENRHLPEVPKKAEVEAVGIDLGELNKILLKKIEELTLYLIEKDKEIIELKNAKVDTQLKVDRILEQLKMKIKD